MRLTEDVANQIVEVVDKTIGEPIEWACVDKERHRFQFKVAVQVPTFSHLGRFSLVGKWNPVKWSFVFVGPSGEQIRKITTPHPGHWDPRRKVEAEPDHKHFWGGELLGDTPTYRPTDIRWHSANTVLADFLKECQIESMYDVPKIDVQMTLGAV